MRALWMAVLVAGCAVSLRAQDTGRRADAAMQVFWNATSAGDREDAGRRIVASGISFEKAVVALKAGRPYGKQKTGKIDFVEPVPVTVNGRVVHDAVVKPDIGALVKWAARDMDRTMVYGAELHVSVP